MWHGQAESVGSWKQHVTGFRSFTSFKFICMFILKPDTFHKYMFGITKILLGSKVSGF